MQKSTERPRPKVVIIGGVAGGMSAATRLRRLREDVEIIVLERGGEVSFANCGLPYYLGGVIAERDALLPQTPAGLGARFALDVRTHAEVSHIRRAAHMLTVRDPRTGEEYQESYDYLLLATGAAPIPLVAERAPDAVPVLSLRTVPDADALHAAIGQARSALVVGAGFIGLEVTENLRERGLDVTLVSRGAHVLGTLDIEMAQPVRETLTEHGVDLRLGRTVTAVTATGAVLDDGTVVAADLVVSAIGVRPESALADAAGLELGLGGGIVVDEFSRSSDPLIFAVGDVAVKTDLLLDEPRLVPLAGLANRHGRSAADAIAELLDGGELDADAETGPRLVGGVLATSIISLWGLAAGTLGWTEAQLRERAIAARIIHTHPLDHVGYYPGAQQLNIKLLVDPETDGILGAQIVGRAGVDRRLDVLATAIQSGLTASDLQDLELAYAPQFGSAKDPITMLGYVNENQALGLDATIQWHELADRVAAGATLLDVRGAGQLAEGLIPGARHVPVEDLRAVAPTLPRGEIIVHCRVGQGAHTAQRLLAELGRDVVNLDGGYLTWRDGIAALSPVSPSKGPTMQEITVTDLAAIPGAALIDVREADEHQTGVAPTAQLFPMSELTEHVAELPTDGPLYVICHSGGRSARVVAFLEHSGIEAVNVTGGMTAWAQAGLPVVAPGA